jgi:serine 3-dehydrogenase (NADP+)
MDLKDKVAVVTGSSAGIGSATALELSQAGARVVITGRRKELLDSVAAGLPSPSAVLAADIADPQTPERLLALAKEAFGRCDILVNNAATMAAGPIDSVDLDQISQMIRVNLDALIRSSYVFGRHFKAQGSGVIINVSSIGAYLISRRAAAYGAVKHAVEAFSQSLRIELAGSGVKVCTIAPGTTETEVYERLRANVKSGESSAVMLKPKDIAVGIRFMLEQPDRANVVRMAIFPSTEAT